MKSMFKKLTVMVIVVLLAGTAMSTIANAEETMGGPSILECLQANGVSTDSTHEEMLQGIKACGGLSFLNYIQIGRMIGLLQKETIDTISEHGAGFKACMNGKGFESIEELQYDTKEAVKAILACGYKPYQAFSAAHQGDKDALMQCLVQSQLKTNFTEALREANACIKAANALD
ncbi:MAG: hypothetical protein HKP58_05630 [Desulfatitalea sp.]|nr:hypothetical protein [Desulfatitalea sp.]NNJ99875.1 hypothetical protein [Desulfatitalea sp.]